MPVPPGHQQQRAEEDHGGHGVYERLIEPDHTEHDHQDAQCEEQHPVLLHRTEYC
jgi:hypothetical protein